MIKSKYFALSSGVESSLWGKKEITQRSILLCLLTFFFTVLIVYCLRIQLNMFKINLTSSLFSSPISHSTLCSWTIIVHCWTIIFWTTWKEFNCWISLNSKSSRQLLILSSIYFCNFYLSFESWSQCWPLGGKFLAVATLNY